MSNAININAGIKKYEIKTTILGYGNKGIPGERGPVGPRGIQGPIGPQGVSGVHVGTDTPPEGYSVWINPNGEGQTIPTKTSDLELDNVYSKSDVDSKINIEVNALTESISDVNDKIDALDVYDTGEVDAKVDAINDELDDINLELSNLASQVNIANADLETIVTGGV